MKKIFLVIVLLLENGLAIELGEVPSIVTLDGENGARVDGTPWCSEMLKNKMHIVFYVDPDERGLNEVFVTALQDKKVDRNKFASIAIINLAASWLPNAMLNTLLEKKQQNFPHTTYVKDKKKILVTQWKLADNNSNILIFDKSGKLIYKKFGKVSEKEIPQVIKLIETNL